MTNQTTNKSFILHLDSLIILEKLSDEQAGKIFKAVYQYQKTGEILVLDFALELALTPFLNQFLRDKEKWLEECKRSSEKGKYGNLKRWHNDLYLQVENGEITLDEAVVISKHRPPILPDPTRSITIPKSLDSKNDSDSDSKNDLEKKLKEKKEAEKKLLENEFEEFWNSYTPVKTSSGKLTNKGAKMKARASFERIRGKHSFDIIFNGTAQYLVDCYQNDTLSCHLSTLLNQERFLIDTNQTTLNVKKEK